MKTCQCKKPIELKQKPLKGDIIVAHGRGMGKTNALRKTLLYSDPHSGKSQLLHGAKAQIRINGTVVATASSLEYRFFVCPRCEGRGWIPTTKTEKKLLEILK